MNPIPHALEILNTGTRIDGRGIGETRDIALSFFTTRGSVLVEKGKTKVIASSKLGILSGIQLRSGRIVVTCNLPSELKETVEHVNLADLLNSTFASDQVVPKDTLVILPGAMYFVIRCSVEVLQDDGGLRDVCIIAAGTSIYHMGLPNVQAFRGSSIDTCNKKQVEEFTNHIMSLPRDDLVTMRYIPLSVTFGHLDKRKISLYQLSFTANVADAYEEDERERKQNIFNVQHDYLIDCCKEELDLCAGCTTIILDKSGLTNGLYKLAGAPISPHDLVQMTVEAYEAVCHASTDIEAAVIADIEARKNELVAKVKGYENGKSGVKRL